MIKFNPHAARSAAISERFLSRPDAGHVKDPENKDVTVTISSEARKKHIMGKLIARITENDGFK